MYFVCSVINTNRLRHCWLLALALCSGGEEGNQTTGEADAEDVVHVTGGSLRLEVITSYRDAGTEWDSH